MAAALCKAAPAQLQGTWVPTPTVQQNGTSMRMPVNRPVSRRSGLQLSLDTRWANNYGYRPVQATVNSPKASTADRLITLRLHFSGWGWYTGETSVQHDFELPAGQQSVTTTVICPQYRLDTQFYWWEVWIDGVKDNDLTLEKKTARMTMAAAITVGAKGNLSCLVVGTGSTARTLMAPNSMQFDVLTLPMAEFPKRWIEYTCFDVVALQLSELQRLSQSNPEAFDAVRRWVRTGGQLWISDVGEKFEALAELSKLLRLRPAASGVSADELGPGITIEDVAEDSAIQRWQPLRFGMREIQGEVVTFQNVITGQTRVISDPDLIARMQGTPNWVRTAQQFQPGEQTVGNGPRRRRRQQPGVSTRWFLAQSMGFGEVHALRGPNHVSLFARGQRLTAGGGEPGEPAAPDAAVGVVDPIDPAATTPQGERMPPALAVSLETGQRWEWRHGMTPDSANQDFADLLVPGVGLAPVTEFRVLITLFVLLIGPANYWFLKRVGRSNLLVLTVPVAALATTAALFGYALLSDGFGSSVRVYSFTKLDQRTGEAACWARQSYYSGLAPGLGLTMPIDVALYPVIPGWNEGSIDSSLGATRDLVWANSEAKLVRGWLRSRTPTQYLAIRARKSPHHLELLPTPDGKLRATNQLGSGIQLVIAADEEGKLFAGENIATDARTMLEPIERIDAIRRFRKLVLDNQPQTPAALEMPESDFVAMPNRQIYRQYGIQYGTDELSKNMASAAIERLAGLTTEPALNLPPRAYVAVTHTGPEVVIGMQGAREQASFHVIEGLW